MTPGHRRLWPWAGVLLIAVGLWIALTPFEHGDSYCGRPLWDADRDCGEMAERTAATGALIVGGLGVLAAASRRRLVALCVCGALVLGLVGVNRLLEPVDERYCGSVLNRHTSNGSDPAFDAMCDELVEPHRRHGTGAFAASAILVVAAGLAWRHSDAAMAGSECDALPGRYAEPDSRRSPTVARQT